jgi:hypothetical protein
MHSKIRFFIKSSFFGVLSKTSTTKIKSDAVSKFAEENLTRLDQITEPSGLMTSTNHRSFSVLKLNFSSTVLIIAITILTIFLWFYFAIYKHRSPRIVKSSAEMEIVTPDVNSAPIPYDSFTVDFSSQVKHEIYKSPIGGGDFHIFSASNDSLIYSVIYHDIADSLIKHGSSTVLEALMREFLSSSNAVLLSRKPVMNQGWPGFEIKYRVVHSGIDALGGRIFLLSQNRAFTCYCVGPVATTNDESINSFLSTFKLMKTD